jgi:hypothetical protein
LKNEIEFDLQEDDETFAPFELNLRTGLWHCFHRMNGFAYPTGGTYKTLEEAIESEKQWVKLYPTSSK